MKKTLYWDIDTEARIKKIKEEFKKDKRVSHSRITRTAIRLTPFDKMVEQLNKEINAI